MYIYIYREREREREINADTHTHTHILQGYYITKDQLKEIISTYDDNGDGKISFEEYCKMVGVA